MKSVTLLQPDVFITKQSSRKKFLAMSSMRSQIHPWGTVNQTATINQKLVETGCSAKFYQQPTKKQTKPKQKINNNPVQICWCEIVITMLTDKVTNFLFAQQIQNSRRSLRKPNWKWRPQNKSCDHSCQSPKASEPLNPLPEHFGRVKILRLSYIFAGCAG